VTCEGGDVCNTVANDPMPCVCVCVMAEMAVCVCGLALIRGELPACVCVVTLWYSGYYCSIPTLPVTGRDVVLMAV